MSDLSESLWSGVVLVYSVHLDNVIHMNERGYSVSDLENYVKAVKSVPRVLKVTSLLPVLNLNEFNQPKRKDVNN